MKLNMSQLMSKLKRYISHQKTDPIEYGNFRKGEKWGTSIENHLIWIFSVDLIWKKELQYRVIYNPDKGTFIGSSNFDRHAKQDHFIQFNIRDFADLRKKLTQLTQNIPAFRERILREYIFGKLQNRINVRWSKVFANEEQKTKEEAYLISLVKHIRRRKGISKSELNRSIHYIANIQSI